MKCNSWQKNHIDNKALRILNKFFWPDTLKLERQFNANLSLKRKQQQKIGKPLSFPSPVSEIPYSLSSYHPPVMVHAIF